MQLAGLIIILLSIIFFRGLVLFPLMAVYIFWSITQWMLDHDRFEETAEPKPDQKDYNE